MSELLAVAIGAGMALLINFKFDQKSIIMLKGKAFRNKLDQDFARLIYKKHANFTDVALLLAGLSSAILAIYLYINKNDFFIISGAIGFALPVLYIWGRVKTFIAADRELDEIAKAHGDNKDS